MTPSPPLLSTTIRGGGYWSMILPRHTALRLTDPNGGANVAALFYNADLLTERYNMPDTLKAQHTAKLTAGHVLYSDRGRILCSITEDSLGWHDPIAGHSNAESVLAQYGEGHYQELRNDWFRNSHDLFLVELGKYNLGLRDLVPNVNFFSKAVVQSDGNLTYTPGHSQPGSSLVLRMEMNVLVVLNTCQHPLDPNPTYAPQPVDLSISRVPPAAADDLCRLSCPENGRGFQNNETWFSLIPS
jgi:uncharacterized protein